MTYTLLTMGFNLLVLGAFSKLGEKGKKITNPVVVFGKVPMFFYLLHLFLYAALGLLLTPHGTTIPIMMLYWILGLLVLYPLCWCYGRFKVGRKSDSLVRFL